MLISFPHRFIYIKTGKTAGTSTEMYFEPWCAEPGSDLSEGRPSAVSRYGVVGARGGVARDEPWPNHMPAALMKPRVEEAFGPDVWRNSQRFCNVRNPYERMVSLFWSRIEDREALADGDFDAVRAAFRAFVPGRWPAARTADKHLIDGETACHFFIRHERLLPDLEEACVRLGLPYEPDRLGRYKGHHRRRQEPARDYFDAETAALVAQEEAWEIARFGYRLEDAV